MKDLNALDTFINEWTVRSKQYYADLRAERKRLHELADSKDFADYWEKTYWWSNNFYGKYPTVAINMLDYSEKNLHEIIEKDAEKRKADFLARISKKVGNISECNLRMASDCEINGTATGDLGTARVSSILAGGWNIQRLHYRVLVK